MEMHWCLAVVVVIAKNLFCAKPKPADELKDGLVALFPNSDGFEVDVPLFVVLLFPKLKPLVAAGWVVVAGLPKENPLP